MATKTYLGNGAYRKTTHKRDGSSEDHTYRKGSLIDITCHDRKGKSHTHEVGRGLLGPYKGKRK